MFRFSYLTQLTAFTLFAFSVRTYSQPLSKIQVFELALAHNPELQAARSLVEEAIARSSYAGRLSNPELSIEYAADWVFNNEGEATFGVGISQSFPLTKRLSVLKNISAQEIELAKAELENRERLLMLDVALACNELSYIEAELALRHSLVEIDEKFAEFVDDRIAAAEASSLDANQIRIELLALKQEISRLEVNRLRLLGELSGLLGSDQLVEVELLEQSVVLSSGLDLPEYSRDDLDTHPEYQLRRRLFEIADSRKSLVLAERWEDITVGLMLEDERSVDEPLGIGNDRFLGVSVSIPLPIRKGNKALYSEAFAASRRQEQALENIEDELLKNAEVLRREVLSLYEQTRYFNENVSALLESNIAEMSEAYGSGLVSLGELFRSQSQALNLRSRQLEMVRDYERALIQWRSATAKTL
ncbi:TolC family protein [Pelagicoccus albus]|uniref:TolC family protein n=1 Tax=Pelagicoccus albus TaxID=415222 RepID=A0A7X1B3S2_9BACT|nr:TolC family protein [Pelagicoccus albus]MBC2605110.1 TolC family protein [Pelagicoccus albus]